MKKYLLALLYLPLLISPVFAKDIWVSDEIEAPLRDAPTLSAGIVTLLAAGSRITLLEEKGDYSKVKTAEGKEGWLSNYYVLRNESVHARFAPLQEKLKKTEDELAKVKQEVEEKSLYIKRLEGDKAAIEQSVSAVNEAAQDHAKSAEKLQSDNQMLQKKLTEQSEKMEKLAKALDAAQQKATTARTRYLSLVKVSENVVEIDKQNRTLQEKAVQFEQELQRLKNENQSLKSQIGKKEFIIGALTILGGVLIGYVLSVMMPPRGRRGSNYNL